MTALLLDHSLIMYGGGMGSNGNLHRHTDRFTSGRKLGGQFQTGHHIA